MKKLFEGTFVRFLMVGVLNTAVGFGVMFALYNLAGLHTWGDLGYWLSSAANYIVGSVLSTFRNAERGWKVVGRFVLSIAVCWVLAYGIAKPAVAVVLSGMPLSQQMQGNLTMLVGAGLFVVLNYAGQRFFAFRNTEKNQ